jgi:hypothetical protein
LDEILDEIKALQGRSLAKRVLSSIKDPERIIGMRQVLNDAIALCTYTSNSREKNGILTSHQLDSTITTSLDIAKILKGMNMEEQLKCVMNKLNDKIGISTYQVSMGVRAHSPLYSMQNRLDHSPIRLKHLMEPFPYMPKNSRNTMVNRRGRFREDRSRTHCG